MPGRRLPCLFSLARSHPGSPGCATPNCPRRFRISGSAYTFTYATLGELIAWIIGWDLILEYAVGAITVAIGWSGYVVSFARDFGLILPERFVSSPFSFDATKHAWSSTGAILNIPAVLIIVMITGLLVVGIRELVRFNTFIVAVKLAVIGLFIVCAAPAFSTANWIMSSNPAGAFIPPNAGMGIFGRSGVVRGAAVVFFAYIGFDAVSAVAQEAKDPMRDLPKGILGSLAICAVLYLAVGLILTGIVPFDRLNVADPIAVGIDAAGIGWLSPLIKLAIVFGLTSVILVMLLAQPRIFRAMAHDGLLPPVRVNSPSLSYSLRLDHRNRCHRGDFRGAFTDRAGRRTRQHRNAIRLCCCVGWNPGAARDRARTGQTVQIAGDLDCRSVWRGDLDIPDVRLADRHLDKISALARDWPGGLLLLWRAAQPGRFRWIGRKLYSANRLTPPRHRPISQLAGW